VGKAENWRFGGLFNGLGGHCGIKLAKWPILRLPNWLERVNRVVSENEAEESKRCIARGHPFGDAGWVETTARQYNLESTIENKADHAILPMPPIRLLTLFPPLRPG